MLCFTIPKVHHQPKCKAILIWDSSREVENFISWLVWRFGESYNLTVKYLSQGNQLLDQVEASQEQNGTW